MADGNDREGLLAHPLFRVALFTLCYMALATWAVVGRANLEFAFYLVVMSVLIVVVVWIHRRVGLGQGLLWALSIWGALHMAGGLVVVPDSWPTQGEFQVLYSWWIIPKAAATTGEGGGWLKYDQVVHAYGFGVATWLCWQGLQGALTGPVEEGGGDGAAALRPTPGLMALVAFAGMGLGALNEVVEFVATRVTVTNVGGYVNTGWDLVYNALGATLAAFLIHATGRRGQHG